jgi:hypothetical protein
MRDATNIQRRVWALQCPSKSRLFIGVLVQDGGNCLCKHTTRKETKNKLSQDRIERLEVIGFRWRLRVIDPDEASEQRCRGLKAFKIKFWHCDVPYSYSVDSALGHWCSTIRYTYNLIQQSKIARNNLCQDRTDRLDKIGFEWKVKAKHSRARSEEQEAGCAKEVQEIQF